MLDQELRFYQENKAMLLSQYNGKFIVIKGQELIGSFDTINDALAEGARRFGLESFLVRRVQERQEEIRVPALTLGLLNANSARSVGW
ncbi:MAG: hypothetical protein AB1817_05025 [Chloroflexota bacterium]